jgi:glycosyltransferase involved in cell wall biosynthesis
LLITFDSMKDPNTGFYYFGKALFESITRQSENEFNFSFYVKDTTGFFDKSLNLYHLHKFHKVFFPYFNCFDLVHITDQFCRLRPGRVNAKRVLTIHDLNQLHQPNFTTKDINKYKTRLGGYIKKCDKIVAISKFVANDIITNFPESESRVSVIYNGADKLEVADDFEPAYIPQKPFIFTLGPLNEKKNFHVLPALLADNNYELVVAGITPVPGYTELLKSEAKKYNCEDRVTITGPISEKEKAYYYKNCLAFTFPSLAEGFGLPVIEAMHFGKPVFLSNKTSLPEIGGPNAFYFESFEAAHMQQVFKNGLKQYETGGMRAGIIKWAERFNWNFTAANYIELYKQLLNTK